MIKLDKKDYTILRLLSDDARLSHKQIARYAGLSKNSVGYRIKRLLEKEVILGFFAIIDHQMIGHSFYEVLIKTNSDKQHEQEFIDHYSRHKNIVTFERLMGDSDFVMEIITKEIQAMHDLISDMSLRFSGFIEYYEVFPVLEAYKVEQLPVRRDKADDKSLPGHGIFGGRSKRILIDRTDALILHELDKDSTASYHSISEKTGIAPSTVALRINNMKNAGVIIRFCPRIKLQSIGYDPYLIQFDLRNVSEQRQKLLKKYIIADEHIRYSFMCASKPVLFMYYAAKDTDHLSGFLRDSKEKFSEIIVNQKYFLLQDLYKYSLFPDGLI